MATTLNNLGNLYGVTQRLKESADAYTEALQIRGSWRKRTRRPICRTWPLR